MRRLGGRIKLNTFAEAPDVLAQDPDAVIVATGGMPAEPRLAEGAELATTTWDILAGDATPKRRVLVFDEHGGEQALSAAERVALAGSDVEIVTPDRLVGHDVTGTLYPEYLANLYRAGARLTPDHQLETIRRGADGLIAVLRIAYTGETVDRDVDQVIVECGTEPNADVYDEIKTSSINRGETDLEALATRGKPQPIPDVEHEDGFLLFRIGDAVAGRNIHAAMLDARRIALTL